MGADTLALVGPSLEPPCASACLFVTGAAGAPRFSPVSLFVFARLAFARLTFVASLFGGYGGRSGLVNNPNFLGLLCWAFPSAALFLRPSYNDGLTALR